MSFLLPGHELGVQPVVRVLVGNPPREVASHQREEDDAERPDVGGRVHAVRLAEPAAAHLRRGVRGAGADAAHDGPAAARDAEVAQLDEPTSGVVEHHVLRLHIAVDQSPDVEEGERGGQLTGDPLRPRFAQAAAVGRRHGRQEVAARGQLLREDVRALRLEGVFVRRHDADRKSQRHLAAVDVLASEVGRLGGRLWQLFQRRWSTGTPTFGPQHATEGSPAERRCHDVAVSDMFQAPGQRGLGRRRAPANK